MPSNTEEFLTRCVVDPQARKFYLYSSEGKEKLVECESIDQFMNVLEVVRNQVSEDCLAYSSPLWKMEKYTLEEFQADFDNLLVRVENGESLTITSEYGDAVMIPYAEYKEVDDLIRIHTDHEEGSWQITPNLLEWIWRFMGI